MDILKSYVEKFNEEDVNLHVNDIDNKDAYEWLKNEIPIFECSDKDIERTYYFRYWTYRKHIKTTDNGYIVTEFLPKVRWSNNDNAIIAAIGLHFSEGRWLKNSAKYLVDYFNYFLGDLESKCVYVYSIWMLYAFYELCKVRPDIKIDKPLLDKMCAHYEYWERTHQLENGMFWSLDGYDAMENSISGRNQESRSLKGVRPTLNSYMCADAFAISEFAKMLGEDEIANQYQEKHEILKKKINEILWKDGFYRAFHYQSIEELETLDRDRANDPARELIGYIPWMFNIPPKDRYDVFDMLTDPDHFSSPYGLTTADRAEKRFLYATRGCQWNGYVWPFATSQTLSALINVINNYSNDEKYQRAFVFLLKQYAQNHIRICDDGHVVPWIDEYQHPFTKGGWKVGGSAQTELNRFNDEVLNNGRGKDYNHSTFCDLVISGLVGVSCENGEISVNPCVNDEIEWFRLSNLYFNGKTYTITYDKTGEKYGLGKGVFVDCNE